MAARDLTLPALGPRLADFARRSGLAGFWPWWTAQLGALVPPKPRAALERRRMRPVLVFDGDHATLWRPGMEGERAVMLAAATIPLGGDAAAIAGAGRAAVASLANGSPGSAPVMPKVVLSMLPRDVLRKTLTLPAAVEPNLLQTLAYDLDRHTPFKADELYFDAVVVGRIPAKRELRVDLVACRKTVVDAAMRHATAWGATVSAAVPDPPATSSASRLNLLPHAARSSRAVWMRWQFWLPLGLVAAVALAAIAIPLWQKRDYAIALNGLAAEARAQATVSDTLRTELETRVGEFNFALERKYAFPSAFRVVDEVSRVLPDDTWLTQMEMKSIAKGKETQREILVRGETANAGRLVQLMEESPLFAQTAPRSPTTKIQPGPGEIFDLGAQVKPLALPAQVALLAPDKSVAAAPGAAPAPPAPVATPPASTPAAPVAEKGPAAPSAAAADPTTPPAAATVAPAAAAAVPTAPAAATAAAPPVEVARPAARPVAPPAAPAARAEIPPPGTPDPWLSAPSSASARRKARAPAVVGSPSSSVPAPGSIAPAPVDSGTGAARQGTEP